MSDFMKAFCGADETPYGFAGWGGAASSGPAPWELARRAQEAFDEAENFDQTAPCTEEGEYTSWDRHWRFLLDKDVARRERERREAWYEKFRGFALEVRAEILASGKHPEALEAFTVLIEGGKCRSRLRYALREMQDDLALCYEEGEVMTKEWVEDFWQDYSGYERE